MQQVTELLLRLKKEGIHIDLQDGQLALDLPADFNDQGILDELRMHKEALISFLGNLSSSTDQDTIAYVGEKTSYPLTASQKRLFFLQEIALDSRAYNQLQLLELKGELDIRQLQQAIQQLVLTHEALATGFLLEGGEPLQFHRKGTPFQLEQFSGNREKAIQAFQRPFDLRQDLLIRAGLLYEGNSTFLLMIDTHHIICDGVSQGVLVADLMKAYRGEALEKPELRLVDMAAYEQTEGWREKIERQKVFWQSEFDDEIQRLAYHPDFKQDGDERGKEGEVILTLDDALSENIRRFAATQGVTSYMLSYAFLNVLFYKLTGNNDITLGTSVAGRFDDRLESVVGMFVNTLALRSDINGATTFIKFLSAVKTKLPQVLSNQEYPYDDLVHQVAALGGNKNNSLFDVLFFYRNYELPTLAFEQLEVSPVPTNGYNSAQFDLNFTLYEKEATFVWQIKYDQARFKASTIKRWAAHLKDVVISVLERPDLPIAQLDTLPGAEKALLASFNDTSNGESPTTMLHLFEAQVQKSPEQLAVISEDKNYTFLELDELSNRIAKYLKLAHQINPGDTIGTLMDRSAAVLPVLYGILKAGGVYVPLGTDHPQKRVAQIISDSEIKVIFKQTQLTYALENVPVIDLDTAAEDLKKFDSEIELIKPLPEQEAYIIHTSGSTGNPKGVVVAHQALANKIKWIQQDYPIGKDDVSLLKTPLTFDVSLQELFWWAASGSTLAVMPLGLEKDPLAIAGVIEKFRVTTIHFVPSMLSVFFNTLGVGYDMERLSVIRKIFTSGETLTAAQVGLVRSSLMPYGTQLINMYGPTETTIHDTHYECSDVPEGVAPPIGKLIPNMRGYVLDQDGNLAPVGTEGDLYLAGIGVSLGYRNQEELTAESFLNGTRFGETIIYKTGDRSYVREDGNFMFLGRIDFQVKLAGNRIELGEIERILGLHPDISEAVVNVVGEDEEAHLVAYYESPAELDGKALEQLLAERLPSYMVPRMYVQVAAMPLTRNGKTDRSKLEPPMMKNSEENVQPKTELEKQIVAAWAELLPFSAEEIGINMNFFELGGTSLMLINLTNTLKERLQRDLSVAQLFNYPTIASLIAHLSKEENTEAQDQSEISEELDEMQDLLGVMED